MKALTMGAATMRAVTKKAARLFLLAAGLQAWSWGHASLSFGSLPGQPRPSGALALAALDRRIADLDTEEESSKRELAGLGSKIGEAHAQVVLRGRAYYRLTRAGMLPLGGGFDALVEHAMHVERARHALVMDLDSERAVRARGVELSHELERVARDHVALATQRTSMDAARIAVEDETRRRAAFDRAFETSGANNEFVPVYGGASTDPVSLGGFAASKGRLLFPVLGRAEVRAARREGTDGPGLEMHAPIGTVVRAVFAGRVAFADRYGPYGRIVIIDHGDHFYSVSGNLAGVEVKVGDEVSAGERVGTIGDDGQGPMLYFEVRHGAETIAPGAWLGL